LTMGARCVPRSRLNPPLHYTAILQPHCLLPTTLHFFSSLLRLLQNRTESRITTFHLQYLRENLHSFSHYNTQIDKISHTSLSLSLSRPRARAQPHVCLSLAYARARRPVPEMFFGASLHYSQSGDDAQED
jgi:hypothetical protein